jgi:outer membrane protein TolC
MTLMRDPGRSAFGNHGLPSWVRWPLVAMRVTLVTGLLAAMPAAVVAEPPVAADLTLTAAVEQAVRENAQLKSLRARWEAMRERPAQAGTLPDPMFTYGGMDMASGGTWPDTDEKRFMIQQAFPWLGKRGLREGIAAKDAEAMQRDLEAMTRDVVMRVKERYYDLGAVQRVIAITREEAEVLQRMAKVAETLYAAGERTQGDVLKAQSEITLLKQKLLELQAREATITATLNTLLNRRADRVLRVAAHPPGGGLSDTAGALFALAAMNSPEILAAQAQVERYELEKRLMARESVPDTTLGMEYRDLGASDDMVMFTVSVDLPVRRSKYRAGIREAEKMRASSQAAREAAERQSALDVQEASISLQTARRTLELYRTELIPQAEARFSASEAGYRTGRVDFMDLLESERFLLGAKIMAAMAEGTLGMQAARLERAVGGGRTWL